MKNINKQLSLLDEPKFKPTVPEKNTLGHKALCMMLDGRKISHIDFQEVTSSWRLAAHIFKLTKMGWPVERIEVTHTTTHKPKYRRICRYFLSREILNKLTGGLENVA